MLGLILAAAIASENCATFEKADEYLRGLGETMMSIGKTKDGFLVFYSTPNGESWTILTVDQEAKTCIIADGTGMRAAPRPRGA